MIAMNYICAKFYTVGSSDMNTTDIFRFLALHRIIFLSKNLGPIKISIIAYI